MIWGVSAYWRHGQENPKSNPVYRANVTTWAMEMIVEKLKRARQRLAIKSQLIALQFEG